MKKMNNKINKTATVNRPLPKPQKDSSGITNSRASYEKEADMILDMLALYLLDNVLSYEEVAKDLGVSKTTISRWMNRVNLPDELNLYKLKWLLSYPYDYAFLYLDIAHLTLGKTPLGTTFENWEDAFDEADEFMSLYDFDFSKRDFIIGSATSGMDEDDECPFDEEPPKASPKSSSASFSNETERCMDNDRDSSVTSLPLDFPSLGQEGFQEDEKRLSFNFNECTDLFGLFRYSVLRSVSFHDLFRAINYYNILPSFVKEDFPVYLQIHLPNMADNLLATFLLDSVATEKALVILRCSQLSCNKGKVAITLSEDQVKSVRSEIVPQSERLKISVICKNSGLNFSILFGSDLK